MSEMDGMEDVWALLTEFSEGTSQKVLKAMGRLSPVQWRLMNRSAAKRTKELEERLNKLNLTQEDREHFSLLRTMLDEFYEFFDANAKGNWKKSETALKKAEVARVEYMKRKEISPT